jgi:hypothetical protein
MISPDKIFLINTTNNLNYKLIFGEDLLNPLYDEEYIQIIEGILNKIKDLTFNYKSNTIQKGNDNAMYAMSVLGCIRKLDEFEIFLKHPVHINKFQKKSGTVFLQARTNIKDQKNNLTKRFCLYVGSANEFPKDIHSPEAFFKGRSMIRKALEPYFTLIFNQK